MKSKNFKKLLSVVLSLTILLTLVYPTWADMTVQGESNKNSATTATDGTKTDEEGTEENSQYTNSKTRTTAYKVVYTFNPSEGEKTPVDYPSDNLVPAVETIFNVSATLSKWYYYDAGMEKVTLDTGSVMPIPPSGNTLTLYTDKTFNVTYNSNYPENTIKDADPIVSGFYDSNDIVVFPENSFKAPSGYSFLGWHVAPNGSGTDTKKPGQTATFAQNQNYYAIWATWTPLPTMKIEATSTRNVYTGQPQNGLTGTPVIKTQDNETLSGANIEYSVEAGPYSTIMPTFTDVGEYQVTIKATLSGYSATYTTVTAKISAKELEWTSGSVNDKVYDGTTTATIATTPTLTGFVNGESVSDLQVTVEFADANAGASKTIEYKSFSSTSDVLKNYTILGTPSFATATIFQKPITWNIGSVNDKVYDGNNSTTIKTAPTLNDVVSGDDISASNFTATFDSVNAGNNITVTATNYNVSGADKDNYSIKDLPTFDLADITKKQLTWVVGSVADKTYDGNTDATISKQPTLEGVISGDDVTVGAGNVYFADANAGLNKDLVINGFDLGGSSLNNYEITTTPSFESVDIDRKEISWTVGTVANKEYDGDTEATIIIHPVLSGFISGDAPTINVGEADFVDANIGTNKEVIGSNYSLSGGNLTNYKITNSPTFNNATIFAVPVTPTVTPTPTPTPVPDTGATPTPTPTPDTGATVTPTPVPDTETTATPTPTPSATPEASPSASPEATPSATPETSPEAGTDNADPTPTAPATTGTTDDNTPAPPPPPTINPDGSVEIQPAAPDITPENPAIDGEAIPDESYTTEEDGALTIAPDYLANLEDGVHVVTVESDGTTFESELIIDDGIATSASPFSEAPFITWSLYNVIATIIGIVFAGIFIAKHNKKDDNKKRNRTQRNYREQTTRKDKKLVIVATVFSVINIVLLLLTQDFTAFMVFFDGYSLLFTLVLAIETVVVIYGFNKSSDSDNDIDFDDENKMTFSTTN